MRILKRIYRRLIPRFLMAYLLVLLLPIALLSTSVYTNAVGNERAALLEAKREALFSDRLYIQNQLQNIEEKYHQFKNSASLRDILDGTLSTDREIMYAYVKEVGGLIYDNQNEADAIAEIRIYSDNHEAVRVLPPFHDMQALYETPLSKRFTSAPGTELIRRFWVADTVNGRLRLTYYAGLMDILNQRAIGTLAIACNEELFALFLRAGEPEEATYFYSEGELVYGAFFSEESETIRLKNEPKFLSHSGETSVQLEEAAGLVQSVMHLRDRGLTVVRYQSFPAPATLPLGFWLCILLFVLLTLLLIPWVFRPLRNITQLARHMKETHSPTLTPYDGHASADEIGDLIQEYNAMVERTKTLSQTIHSNELLLRNAQIEMLQAQLNPHFFYGTLENIRMTAEMHGEALIAEIAYRFGNLMRYCLSREFFVPLEKEVDIVKQYIEIQQRRLGNRFTAEWTLDATFEEWQCPKFVLFSMVENAFTHDVSNSRKTVHIQILLRQDGDELTIEVANDGPGIEAERLALLQRLIAHPEERAQFASTANGRSIFNINDRLQLYYGEHYRFEIESIPWRHTVCRVCMRRDVVRGEGKARAEADAD